MTGGGAIFLNSILSASISSTLLIELNRCQGCQGGGLLVISEHGELSWFDLSGALYCRGNSAAAGGCMASISSYVSFSGDAVFEGEQYNLAFVAPCRSA